jgi:purine-binding chemotaxis protein CheW
MGKRQTRYPPEPGRSDWGGRHLPPQSPAGSQPNPKHIHEEKHIMSTVTLQAEARENASSEATGSIQLVSFHLAEESYGIEITKVREIILMGEITRIPHTPDYVKGLINLRSTVIPVIDLRIRFALPEAELTGDSRIMVINVHGKMIGIVVDAVSEVLRISNNQIAPPPATVAGLGQEYLTGLVRLEDHLLILLDIDKLLGEEDTASLEAMGRA